MLFAATLLHDCVAVEKQSPLRAQASRLAAEKATQILTALAWPDAKIQAVAHAVEAHSFSAGITPTTIEAKSLREADRLDAIGVLGVARCVYTAGRMGSAMYDPANPHAANRALDDKRFAIDHFHTKLLMLSSGFQATTGTRLWQKYVMTASSASLTNLRMRFDVDWRRQTVVPRLARNCLIALTRLPYFINLLTVRSTASPSNPTI